MRRMRWTWRDIMDTPMSVVSLIVEQMSKEFEEQQRSNRSAAKPNIVRGR